MAKVDFKQAKVGAYWDPTGYESTWGEGIGEGWHTASYSMFGERRVYKYISISITIYPPQGPAKLDVNVAALMKMS